VEANEYQKKLMAQKIENELGSLEGKQLAILGLSFKPNTDDMREALSITILNELAKKGAKFKVYDPVAYKEAKWRLENIKDNVTYCENEYETMEGSDALVIITEWNQFRNLNLDKVKKSLNQPYNYFLCYDICRTGNQVFIKTIMWTIRLVFMLPPRIKYIFKGIITSVQPPVKTGFIGWINHHYLIIFQQNQRGYQPLLPKYLVELFLKTKLFWLKYPGTLPART